MRRTLLDDKLQAQFESEGFVTVDLLTPSETEEVIALFKSLQSEKQERNHDHDNTYDLSFFESHEYKRKVFDTINAYFKDKVGRFLDNYKPHITNMFDKEPGTGEVPVHQNWTFVDEDKFRSVSVWIPLTDVSHENGTLEVIPRSHRFLSKVRGPSIPWMFNDIMSPVKKYMEPFNLKVGQVAIIDDAVLHYSSENHTEGTRPAIQLIMIPQEAPGVYYYKDPNETGDRMEVFEATPKYFLSIDVRSRPENLKSLGHVNYPLRNLSEEEFAQCVEVMGRF